MVLTPGPNMIYLISRSITQGPASPGSCRSAASRSALCSTCCARRSASPRCCSPCPTPMTRCAFAGAAYLLWLAWQALKPNGRSPFQVQEAAGRRPAQIVRDGLRHQSAEPEDRDAVSGAAAAVHRSRSRQRADAVAGAGRDPDRHQRRRQRDDRARRRLDRVVSRHAADMAVGAALADGHRCWQGSR